MPWYHHMSPPFQPQPASNARRRRANLALLTAAIINRRPLQLRTGAALDARTAPKPSPASAKSAIFASFPTPALIPSKPNAP